MAPGLNPPRTSPHTRPHSQSAHQQVLYRPLGTCIMASSAPSTSYAPSQPPSQPCSASRRGSNTSPNPTKHSNRGTPTPPRTLHVLASLHNDASTAASFQSDSAASEHLVADLSPAAVTDGATAAAPAAGPTASSFTRITTSVTATTIPAFMKEIAEAANSGVDIIELRLDYLTDFDPERDLDALMRACPLPHIVTYRPAWEGGNYDGPEPERLAVLKYAAVRGAPYVDVEYKAAPYFFADVHEVPLSTQIILSYHDFVSTPDANTLSYLARQMRDAGADIVKIAAMANDITDAGRMLALLADSSNGPTIALSMGEKGQTTRLLAGRYGGYLTFAALSQERASAPGQPTISQLRGLYNLHAQTPQTKLFGIIGNPVSHSRSPLIHNTAFQHIGFNGVYVPLLVDNLPSFLSAFGASDFAGFSVTIPHKEAALKAASSADFLAEQIGAANTLIKQPDGTWRAYNTDCTAALAAIERALPLAPPAISAPTGSGVAGGEGGRNDAASSPLAGRTVVVIGAGGAGRALAFGAASRGANVVVVNRSRERADSLAADVGPSASVADWDALQAGEVPGDVLANSTSVGMGGGASPVPAAILKKFTLVFDAVYTPLWTQLLLDARDAGCVIVDGLQMFVGQAIDQFELFTSQSAPREVMESVVRAGSGSGSGSGGSAAKGNSSLSAAVAAAKMATETGTEAADRGSRLAAAVAAGK